MDSISVVIPVYNAAPNLRELYQALTTVLDKTVERYEIILVEDRGGIIPGILSVNWSSPTHE